MKHTLEATIGNTPLAKLQRLANEKMGQVFLKLEGNNPAGSVKDRPAYSMIKHNNEDEALCKRMHVLQIFIVRPSGSEAEVVCVAKTTFHSKWIMTVSLGKYLGPRF